MINAVKFKEVFGVYATEIWAMPEADFLRWLSGECNGEERKTGKWVLVHPLQKDDGGAYECSCCKSGSWEVNPTTWKACPWCTALMEVDE